MIIKNVCLLLEALSMVFCIHYLYGEKVKLDIATVSYLSIHMIVLTAMNYLGLSILSIIIYPILAVYCGIKFGFKWKRVLVNIVLCVILVGVTQLVVVYIFSHLANITWIAAYQLLIINFVSTFIIIFVIY